MRRVHLRHGREAEDVGDVLALAAEPRLAAVVAGMPPRFDHRPAHMAGKARALVDPHALLLVEAEVRAPHAAVAIQTDELARVPDDLAQLRVVDVAHARP